MIWQDKHFKYLLLEKKLFALQLSGLENHEIFFYSLDGRISRKGKASYTQVFSMVCPTLSRGGYLVGALLSPAFGVLSCRMYGSALPPDTRVIGFD